MSNHIKRCYGTATDNRYDLCDHIKMGDRCWDITENDSFGIVSGYYCCQACKDEADREEGEELVYCADCGEEKKTKDTIRWKWYDFYAPQGDEPLIICNECADKEKHQARVTKDLESYEREMEYYS